MRIAHTSDLHLTEDARRPWRLDDQSATLAAMVDDILATEPDLVLIGGDLYGHEVPHESTPRERGALFPQLVRLAEQAPVVVVAGNHDLAAEIEELAHLGGRWPIRTVTGAGVLDIPTAAGLAHVYALAYPTKQHLLAGEPIEGGAPAAQRAVEAAVAGVLSAWAHRVRMRRRTHPHEPHVGLMHLQVAGCVTSGGEVLAGNEIEITRAALDDVALDYVALGHLHKRQEVAARAWYCGSPWRNDHSEREPKGWHGVEIGEPSDCFLVDSTVADIVAAYPSDPERLPIMVEHRPTACRAFVTLEYAWAEGAWTIRPTPEQLAEAAGAEVRMRLAVSEAHLAGCPWAAEVEAVRATAWRVVEERTIAPVHRVRAPEVAAAVSDADKARAYWASLAEPPTPTEQAGALDAIAMLDALTDDALAAELRAI